MPTIRSCIVLVALATVPSAPCLAQGTLEIRSRLFGDAGPAGGVDFYFINDLGVVTRETVLTPDPAGFFAIEVPSGTVEYGGHIDPCVYPKVEFAPLNQTGAIPLLRTTAGDTVVPELDHTDLAAIVPPTLGETVSFVDGVSALLPQIVARAPDIPYTSLTDSQLVALSAFPTFTGDAMVTDILDVRYIIPEPSSLLLMFTLPLAVVSRRR